MPKLTFFNLTDEKRQQLMEAVEKEFSRVPLANASISNIVKSANIPRGSFYQYFEDKEDAYFFLLNKQVRKSKEAFIDCLEKNNGDLFESMIDIFSYTLEELSVGENIQLLRNAFLNMTHEIEMTFNKIFNANGSIEQFQKISYILNKDNLNISSEKELFHVMQIVSTITLRNLIEKLAHNKPNKEALEGYLIEIELLKKGLYK